MKTSCLQIGLWIIWYWGYCISTADAQPYHPMPTTESRWDMARCWYFYPAGWHDLYHIDLDGSDTVINHKAYKRLYHTTHHAPGTEFDSTYTHFLGGMREEDQRVYFISEYLCLDTLERLIYDFNPAKVGDTIYTNVLTNGSTQKIPHIVTGIDSVDVGGQPRRRVFLEDVDHYFSENWIEGVGSSMGLVYASYWILTDNSYDLNCFYDGNALAYMNPNPMYAFCTPPLPESECDLINQVPDPGPDPMQVQLFPNPVFSALQLEGSDEIRSIQVYNALGTKLWDISFTTRLDMGSLSPGIYFLRFNGDLPTKTFVQRIVKL